MPYKSLASLNIRENCLLTWLQELTPRTAIDYGYYFKRYQEWFIKKGYWSSAQAMLDEYDNLSNVKDCYRHIDILKEYINSRTTGSSNRRQIWQSVTSFYAYHRLSLPSISRVEKSRLFKPSETDKRRAIELEPLTLEEVKTLILEAKQPYNSAIMTVFQGAMALAEFEVFNKMTWRKVIPRLDEPGPMRIDLFREKTSQTTVNSYYTFIGADSKGLLKDWMRIRPKNETGALFVVWNSNKHEWVPLRGPLIGKRITVLAKRSGLIKKQDGVKRYHIHAHEFRDLFKSLCTLSEVNKVASEFFLGHNIDPLGYDKSPLYDEAWFKAEYAKLEPRLNLISGASNLDHVFKQRLFEELAKAKDEMRREFTAITKKLLDQGGFTIYDSLNVEGVDVGKIGMRKLDKKFDKL
jgi:hypothetical protein